MKGSSFLCLLAVCSFDFAQKPDEFNSCKQSAKSQRDLQSCADKEAKRAEAELDRVYQQLLAKAKSDPVAVEKIDAAEQAWIVFRNAHLEAMYPHEDKPGEYGTAYPMCILLLKADLTRQRTKMLSSMLNPVEGHVCDAGLWYQSKPQLKPTSPNNP